jgi:hypothetical protein
VPFSPSLRAPNPLTPCTKLRLVFFVVARPHQAAPPPIHALVRTPVVSSPFSPRRGEHHEPGVPCGERSGEPPLCSSPWVHGASCHRQVHKSMRPAHEIYNTKRIPVPLNLDKFTPGPLLFCPLWGNNPCPLWETPLFVVIFSLNWLFGMWLGFGLSSGDIFSLWQDSEAIIWVERFSQSTSLVNELIFGLRI